MRFHSTVLVFAVGLVLTGCATSRNSAIFDRRIARCDVMLRSLTSDFEIEGDFRVMGNGIGGRYAVNQVNSLSEGNLLSMQAMYWDCVEWAHQRVSSREFRETIRASSTTIGTAALDRGTVEVLEAIQRAVSALELGSAEQTLILGELENELEARAQLSEEERLAIIADALQRNLMERPSVWARDPIYQTILTSHWETTEAIEQLRLSIDRVASVQAGTGVADDTILDVEISVIPFALNSADLSTSAENKLRVVASSIPSAFSARVWGYADERGSEQHNANLSQRRAQRVADALQELGYQVTSYSGVGESVDLGEAWDSNRVVIIEFVRR